MIHSWLGGAVGVNSNHVCSAAEPPSLPPSLPPPLGNVHTRWLDSCRWSGSCSAFKLLIEYSSVFCLAHGLLTLVLNVRRHTCAAVSSAFLRPTPGPVPFCLPMLRGCSPPRRLVMVLRVKRLRSCTCRCCVQGQGGSPGKTADKCEALVPGQMPL